MNGLVRNVTSKVKALLSDAVDYVKEKITGLTGSTSVTVMQLAEYIQNQPETIRTEKELLGTPYSFYHLEKEDVTYYLETKCSRILQLDVNAKDQNIVSYRSYRDQSQIANPIKFSNRLLPE
jgi:hypothetical protein